MISTIVWLIIEAFMIACNKWMYDKSKSKFDLFFVLLWTAFGIADCITLATKYVHF